MGTKIIWTLLMITLFGAMMTTASAADHHVYSGNSVQTVIDGATAGDTIYVHNYTGTYTKFDVNKQLYMIGVDMPTVDGSSGFTIKITANDCTVKGFEVISASGGYNCGEIVVESSGNLIKDNYINSNSNNGMLIHRYCDANFNTVINNTILGNGIRAIKIYGNSNTIAENDLSGSSQAIGIYTPCTGGNLFYHNNMYAAIVNNDGGNTWYNSTLSEGNYYSANSGCTDNDNNGICDIPYQIGADWDQYPLVDTWHPTSGDTTPPASITNLANSTGNFRINWTWNNPSDPDFNHTMVYIDNGWVLNTSGSFYNGSYSAHATKTISTHTADTNGNVNNTWVNQTTTIPNNLPVLDPIGNKAVNETETLAIDADATDSDSDTLTYSCNHTNLFTDFDPATGAGNWTPGYGDAGIYYVDFGAADGYGGIDNETVQITVNETEVTENLLYFSPDTSTVPGYCCSVDVDVMARVNASNPITATDVYITFDPGCINITNWVNNSGVWNGSTCPLWSVPQGYVHITTICENPVLNGTVKIGTLTIHCNNTTCCGTPLNFTSQCMFIKEGGGFIYPERDNGSFLCGWYWKDYNGEEDGGYMPDFDQNQDFDVTQPGIEDNYCAPTAMANSLWWFDQKYPDREVVPLGATPQDLIQELAWLMDTNGQRTGITHNGTYVDDEQAGVEDYLIQHGLTDLLYEHTEPKPEFEWIEAEIERCQDVKLDLGFYEVINVTELQPEGWEIEWKRIGGHAVTAAGVNSNCSQIAVSDPDADNAEFCFPGIVRGPNHNHGGVPFHDLAYDHTQHNDGVSASHDIYTVAPSISPGGTWALTDPYWKDPAVAYWYQENNGGSWENVTDYYGEIPPEIGEIHTEIEAAVVVSPKLEFGDAPDPAYPSLLASDGVRHAPIYTEYLGLQSTGDGKDFEPDANIIDLDLFDDGLLTFVLTANNPAQTVDFEVTNLIAVNDLLVNILLDLNQNGIWDTGEHVVQNQVINLPGVAEGTFTSIPFSTVGATPGPTWMRITLTRHSINPGWNGTMASAGYLNPFECGETEDWEVSIEGDPEPNLIVTAIDAYHNSTGYHPYFNLSNEVDVTVANIGSAIAGPFNVSLYADTTFIGKTDVSALDAGNNTTVQFIWTPIGYDCEDGGTPVTYTLRAIADCDGDVPESDELNNASTADEAAYWAGYSADEPLSAVIHGIIHGALNYTTGDGGYATLYNTGGDQETQTTNYNIGQSIPPGATIVLARLNVYYTWSHIGSNGVYPSMEVNITNTTGPHTVASDAEYNDRPCSDYLAYDYPYGNYVYDITNYVKGENAITVTVKNLGPDGNMFCPSAPGIVILYEDRAKPEYEYWLMEGADLLEGGRRGGAGNLGLGECISNATFTGSANTGGMVNATLGIVSAWGGVAWGTWTSYYWFNNNYLGNGSILSGYGSHYSRTVDGISMDVGASGNAQVGVNVSDVTGYIVSDDNTVSFGDDGDSMMVANAFLLLQYRMDPPTPVLVYGWVNCTNGALVNDPDVVITNLNTSEVFIAETDASLNYYQVLTGSYNVSAGDVLHFNATKDNTTEFNHTVTAAEMDAGGFTQNATIECGGPAGTCGDVNDDGSVDMTDMMTLWYDIADYPTPGAYTISNAWAADVNCDGELDMTDVMTLWYDIADYPSVGAYEVDCCG